MELELDGNPVFAHTGGRPFRTDQPAIILVHGSGGDHTVWRFQARYLAHRGISVAAVDLPGHGRSGGEPLTTIDTFVDWVLALMEVLGVASATIAGHSLGALVALETASRSAPVDGAVLIGAAASMPVHPEMLESAAAGTPHVQSLIRAWSHGSHAGGHPDPGRWMMGETWVLQEEIGLDRLYADLAACAVYENGPEAAAAIRCPVLVIAGRHDRMVPVRGARALADLIPDARLEVLEDAGHQQMIEQPWEVARLIGGFVDSVTAT